VFVKRAIPDPRKFDHATMPYFTVPLHICSLGYQQLCYSQSSRLACQMQRRIVELSRIQRDDEEKQQEWGRVGLEAGNRIRIGYKATNNNNLSSPRQQEAPSRGLSLHPGPH